MPPADPARPAELLGVDQFKVSRITRGQFRGVSEAKLELVTELGQDVKIVVGPGPFNGQAMSRLWRASELTLVAASGPPVPGLMDRARLIVGRRRLLL